MPVVQHIGSRNQVFNASLILADNTLVVLDNQSSIYVLDMDLKNGPVQIANNDLNRTNHGHTVLDIKNGSIIDPNLLQFKLNVKFRAVRRGSPRPLSAEAATTRDTAKMLELRDLCEQRSFELYLISMMGYDITTIQ